MKYKLPAYSMEDILHRLVNMFFSVHEDKFSGDICPVSPIHFRLTLPLGRIVTHVIPQ